MKRELKFLIVVEYIVATVFIVTLAACAFKW